MARAATEEEIARKRRAVSVKQLQWKRDQGKLRGDERALVRMGASATAVMIGDEDLSEWNEEELRRGRRMAMRRGKLNFFGPDPVVVPRQCVDELHKRILDKANEVMRTNLVAAVEHLTRIATGEEFDARDRIAATKMIMDRVMGKEPQKVEATVEVPWMQALRGGIVAVDPVDPVVDPDDEGEVDA